MFCVFSFFLTQFGLYFPFYNHSLLFRQEGQRNILRSNRINFTATEIVSCFNRNYFVLSSLLSPLFASRLLSPLGCCNTKLKYNIMFLFFYGDNKMNDSKILCFYGYNSISKSCRPAGEDLCGAKLVAGILRTTSGTFQGFFSF